MNLYAVVAGVISLFAAIGHLTIGKKQFLTPMLNADFDQLAKKVMHTVFHYITVFLLLSAYMLIMPGIRGSECMFNPTLLFGFIGANYLLFGISQIVIVLRAKLSLLKMFQWMFWVLIAVLSFLAVGVSNA